MKGLDLNLRLVLSATGSIKQIIYEKHSQDPLLAAAQVTILDHSCPHCHKELSLNVFMHEPKTPITSIDLPEWTPHEEEEEADYSVKVESVLPEMDDSGDDEKGFEPSDSEQDSVEDDDEYRVPVRKKARLSVTQADKSGSKRKAQFGRQSVKVDEESSSKGKEINVTIKNDLMAKFY